MEFKIEIRRARPDDLAAIVAVEQASFGADAFSRRQLAYLISEAQGAVFIAEADGKAAGYLSLLLRPRYANVRIYSVAVAPDARGCGVGRTLLDKAAAYARACGARTLTLEVSVTNETALALYRANGFEAIGRIPQYYHDGGDAWRMRREV